MESLVNELKRLGMSNLKVSFEDEGVSLDYFQYHSRISSLYEIPMAVKVGGCEAKTDIDLALHQGATKIVAPMVETSFAASKFARYMEKMQLPVEKYILIESHTGVKNAKSILQDVKNINGVVVGRSDLCASLGLTKADVDLPLIIQHVEKVFAIAKKANLSTIMGGSVSTGSVAAISYLYEKGLIDSFETRKVVFSLLGDDVEIEKMIRKALEFETVFIENYTKKLQVIIDDNSQRIASLKLRSMA